MEATAHVRSIKKHFRDLHDPRVVKRLAALDTAFLGELLAGATRVKKI